MSSARSARREVRNPLLALPAAAKLMRLPPASRLAIAELLEELARDARERGELCWLRSKAPMAAYWRASSVYARHLARVLRRPPVHGAGAEREGEGAAGRTHLGSAHARPSIRLT